MFTIHFINIKLLHLIFYTKKLNFNLFYYFGVYFILFSLQVISSIVFRCTSLLELDLNYLWNILSCFCYYKFSIAKDSRHACQVFLFLSSDVWCSLISLLNLQCNIAFVIYIYILRDIILYVTFSVASTRLKPELVLESPEALSIQVAIMFIHKTLSNSSITSVVSQFL